MHAGHPVMETGNVFCIGETHNFYRILDGETRKVAA